MVRSSFRPCSEWFEGWGYHYSLLYTYNGSRVGHTDSRVFRECFAPLIRMKSRKFAPVIARESLCTFLRLWYVLF